MKLLKVRLTKKADTAQRKLMKVRCKDDGEQQIKTFKDEFGNFQLFGQKMQLSRTPDYGIVQFYSLYEQQIKCKSGKAVFSEPENTNARFCLCRVFLNKDGTMEIYCPYDEDPKAWIWRNEKHQKQYRQKFQEGDYSGVKNALKQLENKARKWKQELEKEERNFLASNQPTEREKDYDRLKSVRLCGQLPTANVGRKDSIGWHLVSQKSQRGILVDANINPYDGSIILNESGDELKGYPKRLGVFGANESIQKVIDFLKKKYDNNRYRAVNR